MPAGNFYCIVKETALRALQLVKQARRGRRHWLAHQAALQLHGMRIATVSVRAVDKLGNRRNLAHVTKVMTAAKSGRDPAVTKALVLAIYAMNAPGHGEFLLNLLDSTRIDEVRETAADLIASTSGALRKRLATDVGNFRHPAANYYAYRAATRFDRAAPSDELLARALQGKDARLRLLGYADVAWLGKRDTRPQIIELLHEPLAPGVYEKVWDGVDHLGRAVGSGTYLAVVRAANQVAVTKLMLLK